MASESARSRGSDSGAPSPRTLDIKTEHTLKNHLAIILGFCELLLGETPAVDPRHADLLEMHRAAKAVMAMFPDEEDV